MSVWRVFQFGIEHLNMLDRVFDMDEVVDVLRHMECHSHAGKVVIRATS
jgi:hypothetical protein